MAYTIEDFPIETDQPIIEVSLPVGAHVLELVVEDSAGLKSAPDTVVITVEREVVPIIESIEASSGQQGQTLDKVVITGQFLDGTSAVIFPEESGIRGDITSVDGTSVVLSPLVINVRAVPGAYSFQLQTPQGLVDSGRVTFQVTRAPIETPVIRSIEPPSGQAGQTLDKVALTGELLGSTKAVIFPEESGIRGDITSVDDTSVVLSPLAIAGSAMPGSYPFRLETELGPVGSGRVIFQVMAAGVELPVIRGIEPPSGRQGETLDKVAIIGERLARATAVTFLRGDPRDPRAPWVPDPEMTAKVIESTTDSVVMSVNISSRAEPGGRRFAVTTPAGTGESPAGVGFTVESGGIIAPIPRQPVDEVPGIGRVFAERLAEHDITDLSELVSLEPAQLADVLGVSEARATGFIEEARRLQGG